MTVTRGHDIGSVIAQLGLNGVTLAGYSIGGTIAMCYASKGVNPPVDRLVYAVNTSP